MRKEIWADCGEHWSSAVKKSKEEDKQQRTCELLEFAQAEERRSDTRGRTKMGVEDIISEWRQTWLQSFLGSRSLPRSRTRCEHQRQTGRQHLALPWHGRQSTSHHFGLLSKDDSQPQHLDTTSPMSDEHVIIVPVEPQLHNGFLLCGATDGM